MASVGFNMVAYLVSHPTDHVIDDSIIFVFTVDQPDFPIRTRQHCPRKHADSRLSSSLNPHPY
jgi:hypothetical protein